MDAYRAGRVAEEPQITDRILGAIEDRLQTTQFPGVQWRAKTLRTGRGSAAEEKRHGADLLGVLDIELPKFQAKKGFLAQAKLAEPGNAFSKSEWARLSAQCKTMLARTPDAFVFAYSQSQGLRIIPATAVVGYTGRNLFDLYNRAVAPFFESFIECFIGDPRLDSPDIATLDEIIDFRVDRVLALEARG
jgi:hypothetical protein